MRRLDFVGRNSNPSSFQSLSNFAVPGIPSGFTSFSAATFKAVDWNVLGDGVMKADAVASDDNRNAVENLIFGFYLGVLLWKEYK